ncbi:MAG: hypothetical protein ACXW5U_14240 [Thermoanaerobaculia bacterium]
MRHPLRTFLLALIVALPASDAQPIGGQLGVEFAIDAPWRIEPVRSAEGWTYGPIPVVIAFHDAIFDHHRGLGEQIVLFDSIHIGIVSIEIDEQPENAATPIRRAVPLGRLREIERKR